MIDWHNFASPREAARKTGYSASHVRNLAKWGCIEASNISGRWVIYIPSLKKWREKKMHRINA